LFLTLAAMIYQHATKDRDKRSLTHSASSPTLPEAPRNEQA